MPAALSSSPFIAVTTVVLGVVAVRLFTLANPHVNKNPYFQSISAS